MKKTYHLLLCAMLLFPSFSFSMNETNETFYLGQLICTYECYLCRNKKACKGFEAMHKKAKKHFQDKHPSQCDEIVKKRLYDIKVDYEPSSEQDAYCTKTHL